MQVADTLAFVRGDWRAERVLTDHRSGGTGAFTGTARFAPVPWQPGGPAGPAALRHTEHGELRFGDYRGPAGRELIWLAAPGGTAQVRFPDGRAFYPADLRAGRWHAEHRCGRDRYQVSYLVLAPDLLEERWQAHGPGKDYLMITTLARLPAGSLPDGPSTTSLGPDSHCK